MDSNDKKGKKTTPLIKEVVDLSTDSKVDFTVRFVGNEMQKLITKKYVKIEKQEELLNNGNSKRKIRKSNI